MTLSTDMAAAADRLSATSRSVLDGATTQHDQWQRLLAAGLSGQAAFQAINNLHTTTESLYGPGQQMAAVSDILAQFAPLQKRLEQLAAIATLTSVTSSLRALGNALDWACAHSIDALCTPAAPPPPTRLADYAGLDIPAIHEIAMSTAPASVRDFMDANPDAYLLEASESRVVTIVGLSGPATQATSVTTFVPGVGSSAPSSWESSLQRTRTIATATGGPAIMWSGYNAPANLHSATHAGPARAGADELRRFQRALNVRFGSARKIVVGYSYGSVVTGTAAASADGLHADDVVFVGSPGVGVSDAGKLRLHSDDPQVHAITAIGDPIDLAAGRVSGVHGKDPTTPGFGTQVWPGRMNGNHGSYFSDPVFLDGLAAVASRPRLPHHH